ncbi:hypothetical protein CFP65_3347 [Kitasatospora sp. MMS16-BH015]|uniref:tetratricopeptide repeat protein n=1 Tax=Kitasatospora sp. MMS16-BH015 TaxID=2018025 RepID=UPI000CA3D106|nr:tetratricopeptide repeat protein [Kitasatospora sp. MMS16-BH015]AUG78145.1 hypothetical protein CFP65_3347 [Kitasatospora sp. MMS16-BH015]
MSSDIWAWVQDTHGSLTEAGHHRLAGAIAEIAGHAVEGRDEQLDALYPEALASARALGLPWVEVFLRHWRLQSLLNKRHQGEAALAEAVSLLEYAHREETAACPQSVCAVQDFTICHANIDGPGYVPERLAVLEETLARVEPGRACFDCLSREYADTLEDDARPADALAHLDRAQGRIQAAGGAVSLAFGHSRASALRRLGRQEEALAAYDTAELAEISAGRRPDEDDTRKLAVGRALLLAELGRHEAALELLPEPGEADRYPDIRHRWAAAVEALVNAGAHPNDADLGARLARWAGYLDRAGSHRPCLDLLLTAARLAVRRGARTIALTLCGEADRKLAQLRRTEGVTDRLAETRSAALALPRPELPATDLLPWLTDLLTTAPDQAADLLTTDPEHAADLLDATRTRLPTDPTATIHLATTLATLGLDRPATDLLWHRLTPPGAEGASDGRSVAGVGSGGGPGTVSETDPAVAAAAAAAAASGLTHSTASAPPPTAPGARTGEVETSRVLAELLVRAGDGDGVRRLAEWQLGGSPADAHWTRARWAAAEGRWREVVEQCTALLVLRPEAVNARRLAASAATRLGEHGEAQRLLQELLEHALPAGQAGPDELHRTVQEPDLWGLVTAASANRDWAVVRSAGALLGLDFEQESGPVEEEWQLVTVRTTRTNGTVTDLPALRTGPATARILPVLGEEVPLNHRDLVVFAPARLNELPAPGEAEGWRPVFELLTLLDPAGWTTYWLDGVWPGESQWLELRDELRAAGYAVWVYSGPEYAVADPADPDGALPGIYAALGVPPTGSAAAADTELHRHTAAWIHPLCWTDLAEAAGADPTPHHETAERYGL